MIRIKKRWEIPEAEVTPEALYRRLDKHRIST